MRSGMERIFTSGVGEVVGVMEVIRPSYIHFISSFWNHHLRHKKTLLGNRCQKGHACAGREWAEEVAGGSVWESVWQVTLQGDALRDNPCHATRVLESCLEGLEGVDVKGLGWGCHHRRCLLRSLPLTPGSLPSNQAPACWLDQCASGCYSYRKLPFPVTPHIFFFLFLSSVFQISFFMFLLLFTSWIFYVYLNFLTLRRPPFVRNHESGGTAL